MSLSDVYEVGLAKKTIEHKEPIVVGFLILQYATLRMLELYDNFLYTYTYTYNIYECIRPEVEQVWRQVRSKDRLDNFRASDKENFFPRECCDRHVKFDKRTPGLLRCSEMTALCLKTYCCKDEETKTVQFSSKGIN